MTLPELYTIHEVAAAMKLKPDTVLRHISRHSIRTVGSGRGRRLTRDGYDELIRCLCSGWRTSRSG